MTKFGDITTRDAVAVVTGAARGIGLAIAILLSSKHARVAVFDLDADMARAAAAGLGPRARGYGVDVGDPAALAAAIDAVERDLGPIDIYVNNAGVMPAGQILDENAGVAEATFRANFWPHYHSFRILAPRMIERGRGHFINVTSAAGFIHSGGLSTYVASKHAATGFARSAREELTGTGVTLSAVIPAAVRTQLVDGIPFQWWERIGILRPKSVARAAVRTIKHRPALVGVPFGTVVALRLYPLIPEWLWLWGRRIVNADRVMHSINREQRREYDARITRQVVVAEAEAELPSMSQQDSAALTPEVVQP